MSGESSDLISHALFEPGPSTLVLGRRGLLILAPGTAVVDDVVQVVLLGSPGFAVLVAQHLAGDQCRSPFAVVERDIPPSLGVTVLVRGDVGLSTVLDDAPILLEGSAFATWREHRLSGRTVGLTLGEVTPTRYLSDAPCVLPVSSACIVLGLSAPPSAGSPVGSDATLTAGPFGLEPPTPPPAPPSRPPHPTGTAEPPLRAAADDACLPPVDADRCGEEPAVSEPPGAFGLLTSEPRSLKPPGEPPSSTAVDAATSALDRPSEPGRTPYDFSGRSASPFGASSPVAEAASSGDATDRSTEADVASASEDFQTTAVGSLRDQLAAELDAAPRAELDDDLSRTIARPGCFGSPAAPAPAPACPSPAPLVRARTCGCGSPCDPLSERCPSCGASLAGRPVVTGPPPVVGRLRFDDGQEVALLGPLTLGRQPPSCRTVGGVIATPVPIADPEQRISLFHLEVRVEEWTVSIVDYGSTNHTWATLPDQNPVRLRSNHPFTITPGTTVDLGGQRTFVYIGGPG